MEQIRIDIGVCSGFYVPFTEADFVGVEKFILTIKNFPDVKSPVIVEREFSTPGNHYVVITPEESVKLNSTAEMDLNKVLIDGNRHKMGDNYKIILRRGVGDCFEHH